VKRLIVLRPIKNKMEMRLDDNKIHIFMHGTIVFWCRCTEEFPPSLTRVDILVLCMATGGGIKD
jgi:hypothetical protein